MTHISESDGLSLSIPITKATEAEDGSVYVEGLCTDDGLDLDSQIIDRDFAIKGLTDWFSEWGNVRQQHSSNLPPAGKAVDMEVRPEGVWIRARIVEPTAAKLVKEKVYSAFSVGVSQPRIIRDPEGIAKNGRVVDGIFSEVSVVDYPANPRAKFQLAKRASSGEVEIVEKAVEVELTKSVPTPADVFGAHDKGGWLPSGVTEVTNTSGEPIAVVKRDISDKERDKIPAEDFAGPDETYPIVKPEDVASAAHLVGKADDPEAVKAKIIAIAKRKGPDFVAELPESWTKEEKSADAETTAVEPEVTKGARDCPGCGKSHHADSSAKYCADCGKKLPDAAVEKSAEAEVVAPEAPAETEPAEEPKVEKSETPEAPAAEAVEKAADAPAGPDPSAFTPGSSAWEAADAAKAGEAVQGLIALRSSIRDLAAREQAEGDDQENVWNLNDAAFAVDSALAVLARFAATEQAEANDAAAAGKGLEADLVKSAVEAELVKFAPAAEVEALRADLTAEREARETLEKRLAELEKSPDPHNRAYRGAPLAALRPQAGEATAGRGDAGEPEVLKSIILKARKDITGPAAEQLKKAVGAKQAAALIFGEGE